MTIIFALFFLLLGFVGGIFLACTLTIDMLRDSAKNDVPFIGKYRITLIKYDNQE